MHGPVKGQANFYYILINHALHYCDTTRMYARGLVFWRTTQSLFWWCEVTCKHPLTLSKSYSLYIVHRLQYQSYKRGIVFFKLHGYTVHQQY